MYPVRGSDLSLYHIQSFDYEFYSVLNRHVWLLACIVNQLLTYDGVKFICSAIAKILQVTYERDITELAQEKRTFVW